KPVGAGVRETAVISADNGKTWKPWFDIIFRARSNSDHGAAGIQSNTTTQSDSPPRFSASAVNSTSSSDDDLKTVAALDPKDQAAVEKNDVAAMDRILADDFVLVTGAGKSYTKSDLLNEARSGRVVYGRQSDTDQKVRLFGDTAVVTAKLTAKG